MLSPSLKLCEPEVPPPQDVGQSRVEHERWSLDECKGLRILRLHVRLVCADPSLRVVVHASSNLPSNIDI